MEQLVQQYKQAKHKLKSRLNDFKNLSKEQEYKEFMFCLLTPQSNAQRCWQAVEQISNLEKIEEQQIYNILKTKTRFHKTKTSRILKAEEMWKSIEPNLKNENKNIKELRDFIAKIVNGYGVNYRGLKPLSV